MIFIMEWHSLSCVVNLPMACDSIHAVFLYVFACNISMHFPACMVNKLTTHINKLLLSLHLTEIENLECM